MNRQKKILIPLYLFLVLRFLTCVSDIVPIFAYQILHYTKYYSVRNLSLYQTFLCILYAILFLLGGRLADVINRKKILIYSEIICIISILVYFVIKSDFMLIIAFVFIYSVYSLSTPGITTMTLESTNKESSTVLSLLTIAMSLSIGTWSIAISRCKNIENILLSILFNNILAVILCLFIPETEKTDNSQITKNNSASAKTEGSSNLFGSILERKYLIVFTFAMSVFMFNLAQLNISIPIMLDYISPKKGSQYFSLIVCINALVIILGTYPLNHKLKKFSDLTNIKLAALLYVIGFGILLLTQNIVLIALSTIIWTLGQILANIYGNAFIIKSAPEQHVGSYIAFYSVFSGIGTFLGPVIAGIILNSSSYSHVWQTVIAVSLISIIFFQWIEKQNKY